MTTEALRAPFTKLAALHTLTGVDTRVVTHEELCGTCSDVPKAIKDYLQARTRLKVVVLGGDLAQVPARVVYDEFANTMYGVSFAEYFYTDYYYSDLSQWDANGDGIYAQDGTDAPDYRPELGVTRISVSNQDEIVRYIEKVVHHMTAYRTDRIGSALFLSNVATTVYLGPLGIDVDSAIYFEMEHRTLSLFPEAFSNRKKLYATGSALGGAEALTVDREVQELQSGYNLVVHAGHGGVDSLTVEYNGNNDVDADMAYALTNTEYPIFLSCACSAGEFDAEDSAGETLVNAPAGGAIGYLGNSATGLGLAGGNQLIDEFLRYALSHNRPLVGEALRAAHQQMPSSDGVEVVAGVVVPSVDLDSYEWTQKSTVYFGDGLIPIWTDPQTQPAPAVHVTKRDIPGGMEVSVTVDPVTAGTLALTTGTRTYRAPVTGNGAVFRVPETTTQVWYGFSSPTTLFAYGQADF